MDYKRLGNQMDISRPTQRHNYKITDFFSNYEDINTDKLAQIPGAGDRFTGEVRRGR